MKFAAIIQYSKDQNKIQTVRPRHRLYLAELKEKGKLAASGPFTDDSGTLIIYGARQPRRDRRSCSRAIRSTKPASSCTSICALEPGHCQS